MLSSSIARPCSGLGDRVTGEFFEITGPKHRRVGVKHLKKLDGTLAVEPEEFREVATDFYRDLLTTDLLLEAQDGCRQQVWEHIQRRVTDPMQASLAQPFSVAKLRDALRALPQDSFPGEDGLAPIFFL